MRKSTKPAPKRRPAKPAPKVSIPISDPAEIAGRWVAYADRERTRLIAVADTFAELMERVEATGEPDPLIETAPGIHPANRGPIPLLEGEALNVIDDIRKVVTDPDRWLDTPHVGFAGRKPRDLIGTEDEKQLRWMIRDARYGSIS